MVTYIEYGECNYKETKIQKNQGQGFVSKDYLGAWKWRNTEEEGTKVKCIKCGRKDIVTGERIPEKELKKILCPECGTGKKKPW